MAEAERSFLGLTHNPFVEPHRGFFDRGGRKTQLEQLRHLSEWSRRVLLVTGPEGVGKTTLYRELAATLEPRVKAARIHAGLVNTGREVLSAIAQGFGVAVPGDANLQHLEHEIIAHVAEQTDNGERTCLVLVDDAHLLDNKAVDELIGLAHRSALHLVLFGEVRMVPAVERVASSKGVGWQELRLTGYGEADARDYLEWRFQQAKYRGRIPFADSEVKDLIKLSEGLPGRMNQMANVLLVKLEAGEGAPGTGAFPKAHGALLALLVAVVALLYVLFSGDASAPGAGQTTVAELSLPDRTAAPDRERGADGSGTGSADAPAATDAEGGLEDTFMAGPGGEESGDEEPLSMDLPAANLSAEADPEAQESERRIAVAATTVDATDQSPVEDGRAADESPAAVPSIDDAAPAPAATPVEAVAAAPVQAPEPDPAPMQEPEPEPDPGPGSALPEIQTPAGVRDGRWLLQQNPEYFTLQLVTVSAAERAVAFVEGQLDPREFAIYRLQRDGRMLHVVVYGLFSSRAAAERAANNLPSGLGEVQPWIRPVEQVQTAARTSLFQ
ncbi:MAG: AAA family ATPase [Pseudomonadota bacterium]